MKKFLLCIAALSFVLFQSHAIAQIVQAKGVTTVTYGAVLTPQDKENAYQSAQMSAVERYFAENGEAESQNFETIQDSIRANLNKFILSTTILNEDDQPSFHKYSLVVRVELNIAKLKNTLKTVSAVTNTANADKSQLVYLFVGREVASVRTFDAHVVKRAVADASGTATSSQSTKGTEGESIKGHKVSTNASKESAAAATAHVEGTVETGGSSTQKMDEMGYKLLPMDNQKTSITSTFSQAGFSVADPEFVLSDGDMKAVKNDYSNGSDCTPATLRAVVQSLRKAQVPYLVLATLDVGTPGVDPASGLTRVSVLASGRVLDLKGNLPREVAAVPPVQIYGVGSDYTVAMNKALKDASIAAAREVVSQLNAAGIR
ncbi:MAG TPA: hypothetical protein VNW52_13205 [Burkholderiaceae bacterium]|jgi:hypothetical protein|nr:hypothetical protein [Burkholderiaceae bacterium]